MHKFYLAWKFLATYVLLALTLISTFSFIFYYTFERNSFVDLRGDAVQTALATAESVNFSGFETLKTPDQSASAVYRRIFDDLYFVARTNPQIEFVYTMRLADDGRWVFVVDADPEEDENGNGIIDDDEAHADIGEEYDVSCCPELPAALYGPIADRTITKDQWGQWISGYAPIYNDDKSVIGIVGVDINAQNYLAHQRLIFRLLSSIWVITISFSFIFGGWGVYIFWQENTRVQEALQIRNAQLEEMVKRRTKNLQQFMAMLVHELRAPLVGIKWTAQELLENGLSKKDRNERLDDVVLATDTMLDIVNKFLDTSKVSLRQLTVDTSLQHLEPLIRAAVTTYEAEAERKGLFIQASVDSNVPDIMFDKGRILQVLNNLISNAIKYTEQGGIKLHVSFTEDKKSVRVEVHDTGIGIPKKYRKSLFEPFMRVGESKEPGSGLGLAISKGIIEAHKGHIGFMSASGQGSTFWFELPIERKGKK